MVLEQLGKRINTALRSLSTATIVDEKLLDAILKEITSALLESDVNVKLVQSVRKNIKTIADLNNIPPAVNKQKFVQKAVFDELCKLVDPGVESYKPKKGTVNVVLFVGLQGSGKTTSCTKLASYYQRKSFKTCLVCADTFRAGAFDQLKQNATKAKIPFYGSYTESDPAQIAFEGVDKFKKQGFEVIIVDTSGRHKQESELFQEMKQIQAAVNPDHVILVMDGSIGQAADAQARAFKDTVEIGSIIITKMDGHAKGGGAISAVATTGSPILFIGTGEHIHDLEPFNARQFIGKMLGMGDLKGLMETVSDLKLDKNNSLLKTLTTGVFTLRDMYQQFKTINSMGPLSKVMGMLPGVPPELLNSMSDEAGAGKIKKLMCLMDSMTAAELDSDSKLFQTDPSRIYRVCRGSGATVRELEELLVQYKTFAGMFKKMGGKNMMKNMSNMQNAGTSGGKVHPNQMAKMQSQMSQMTKMLPPGMMEQMGGMGGIQNMMSQMMSGGGMPGMPDMSQLASMMGGMGMGGGMQNPSATSKTSRVKRK